MKAAADAGLKGMLGCFAFLKIINLIFAIGITVVYSMNAATVQEMDKQIPGFSNI